MRDIAEQLNFADLILHVIGSSSFVKVVTVHFLEIQVLLLGQLSSIVIFFGIWRVNVWNSGLEVVPAVALIDWSAQQVRPTT